MIILLIIRINIFILLYINGEDRNIERACRNYGVHMDKRE